MKSITIELDEEGMSLKQVGLTKMEVVGLLATALWDIELQLKLGFSEQYKEGVKKDGTTSDSDEAANGSD